MAIHEFREALSVDDSVAVGGGGYLLYNKRINLRSGMRHTVNFIDFFDDSQLQASMATEANTGAAYLFYVSKYPVIPTDMIMAQSFVNAGPLASDPNVLFKASMVKTDNVPMAVEAEFPNQFLGSSPTFSFYTEHLYLTLILYDEVGPSGSTFVEPQMSVYMAIDSKKVMSVEYMMGYYKEYQEAQLIQLLNQGVLISDSNQSPAEQMGNTFPMWLAGGIRPERMLKADALADWWHSLDGNFAEKTQTVATLRQYYDAAKTMVGFTTAFGVEDAVKGGIPDWIKVNALPSVVSGPLRVDFPVAIYPTSAQIAAGTANVQVMT